jgi:hypothetical protein
LFRQEYQESFLLKLKCAGCDPPTLTLNLGSQMLLLLLLFLLLLFDVQLAIFTFSPMLGFIEMEK